ncbi:hypothetical protein ACFORG_20320, partial [Lutimaribacter marinistellae]
RSFNVPAFRAARKGSGTFITEIQTGLCSTNLARDAYRETSELAGTHSASEKHRDRIGQVSWNVEPVCSVIGRADIRCHPVVV